MTNIYDCIENVSCTENGATGYKSTGKVLVDFFFKVSSFRDMSEEDICEEFQKVLDTEDIQTVIQFLFYIRDPRNGLGERRLFRVCMKYLLSKNSTYLYEPKRIKVLFDAIMKYGRADDMFHIFDVSNDEFITLLDNQLYMDSENFENGASTSLLAKWLPSENASSKETKMLAKKIRKGLNLTSKEYRKVLSELRKYLKVTETYTCSNRWNEIDYKGVPSKANILYKDAFIKHDKERRLEFLEKLSSGDETVHINSSVNFPHDIVTAYRRGYYRCYYGQDVDSTLEELWKNLKVTAGLEDTIVVRDGSGSMCSRIGKTQTMAADVADALAIYCSQYCNGPYKNRFITFSAHPELVDLTSEQTLLAKLVECDRYAEISNTDIEAVFDLILYTALDNNLKQEDLPKQILIISDMEFDEGSNYRGNPIKSAQKKFKDAGYIVPKLIFWNTSSRSNTIPIKENELGVMLVSGFSQNVVNMLANGETDAYQMILKEIERYKDIELN